MGAGGWPFLLLGVAAIICAVAYTGGPFPLGYLGLGEVFVFIFFGPVAVARNRLRANARLDGIGTRHLGPNRRDGDRNPRCE